jgi:predicted Fe-Mo cluster-binding NifX family protein
MTKIAVSSEGPSLDQAVDPRFGRAAGFMIVDPTDMSFEYLDNGGSQAMAQGAGIQAAESVVRSGAKVVLTGFVGPKAFHALQSAGIEIGQNLEKMNVGQAVQAYLEGRVNAAQAPNSGGHGR